MTTPLLRTCPWNSAGCDHARGPEAEFDALAALLDIEERRIIAGLASMSDPKAILLGRSIHSLVVYAAIVASRKDWHASARFASLSRPIREHSGPMKSSWYGPTRGLPARAKNSHPRPAALLYIDFTVSFYENLHASPPPPVHWIDASAPVA